LELEDDERELIASLASQAAITIENARLFAAQQDEVEITKALLEVSTIIAERDTLSNILERIVALTGRLLGADACLHFHFDDENDLFVPDAQHGLPPEFVHEFEACYVRPSDSQAAATIYYDRKPVIIDDVQNSPLKLSGLMSKLGVKSMIVLPLTAKSRLFGTINVLYFNKAHHFTLKEIAIAEGIAVHTAVALDNAELYSKIEAHRLELLSLSRKVVEAQEEERRRISRELHDEAGQALTAIKINIEMVERELPADGSGFRRRLVEAKDLVDLTLQEVRRLSHELRPSILDDLGLLAALRWYTYNFSKRTGIAVALTPEEMPERLPPEIETTLYRVVQEALTNVIRHSGARLVTINLYRNKGRCRMIVCDDGHGVSAESQSDGIGLLGMRERVRLFGGSVVLESLERGAQLIVDVPVDSSEAG
jgi:signal transduction histidine kinase